MPCSSDVVTLPECFAQVIGKKHCLPENTSLQDADALISCSSEDSLTLSLHDNRQSGEHSSARVRSCARHQHSEKKGNDASSRHDRMLGNATNNDVL